MIPRATHQIHLGGKRMPNDIKQWRELLLEMHPDWTHHLWTEANVAELGLEPHQWEHATFAGSANVIRLHAVERLGGVYLDTDIECLRPLDSLLGNRAFVAKQPDGIVCNAFFGAEAHHPWLRWQLANYGDPRTQDAAEACHLMSRAPMDGVHLIPTELIYPWAHDEDPAPSRITKKTFTAHFWAASWITT